MCGLAGFINFENNEWLAKSACITQRHRGPDAQKTWVHDNVALSHQRLSIIDPDPRSDQPFVKDGLAIIFNGEIYNYKQLKAEITRANTHVNFITTSDTEALLELYRLKKEKCLDDIIGMFAFAIYETETGKLFAARDHFGIKPLFYTQIANCIAFASELKSLVHLPGFDKTINMHALTGAINYLWVPGNVTMFRNCHKLPPAHYMSIDTLAPVPTPHISCYWQIDTDIDIKNEEQALATFTECMERTIQRHMVSDVPVSSFLSGGVDSSLISVMAAKINPGLSTYTIALSATDKKVEQMPEDEKYARQLASKFNFDHHEIQITPEIIKLLPEIVHTLDEPIGDPAAINTFLICKAARDRGVKVLLSGMGADEILFGYRRQKATLLAKRYRRLPSLVKVPIRFFADKLPVRTNRSGNKLTRWTKRFLSFADLPTEEAYMKSYSYYNEQELRGLFRGDVGEEYRWLRQQHSSIFNKSYKGDPINQMCYTDIHMFMVGLNLSYTDKASMAASVEVRVPFIDKEVVTLAMQIEGSLKYGKGQSKYILKRVAEKFLPREIIYRPKSSFGAPLRSWISNDLKNMVNDLLSKENVEKRNLFNYGFIKKLIDDDRAGNEDNAYRIYQLLTVELWFRAYVDPV
ncbi:MAG TPA: asparagine synthase (glutamine-hydrolyzing) [Chitinophagaceae bacterium]|nr:asparagine synthase (glutamine-hydrolyzing) [Chitinophagaceae bacterium]